MNRIILTLFLSLAAMSASADDHADILKFVEARYDQTVSLAKTIWDLAEVGYQEHQSSALLQETLKAEGFEIETGVAGMPTAFVASYGKGEPVIGILAEFDALPGINQNASPVRSPIEGKAAGHACGHNLFGAASTQAAMALAHWLGSNGKQGTVRLYGTPAEEGGSGKVYMVREGLFEDVDIVMHWHPSDKNSADARTSLANRSAKFRFRGVSAHAAAAPDKARSALDGVEAFNMMANMMREHVPQQTRIHYVITNGGNAPNVVPDFAEVFYYCRHPEAAMVREIWKRLEDAARGAALGTGTTVDWEIIHGNHPLVANETLQKMMHEKLTQVGGVTYDREEQKFAEELVATLNQPSRELGSQEDIQPYTSSLGYGSTDVGDVSIAVPTVEVRTACFVPGTPSHSWQSTAAAGMSIGFKGAQVAAKTLTLAGIELFENEALRRAAREEFDVFRGSGFVYEALLGDREPPLDYRR